MVRARKPGSHDYSEVRIIVACRVALETQKALFILDSLHGSSI